MYALTGLIWHLSFDFCVYLNLLWCHTFQYFFIKIAVTAFNKNKLSNRQLNRTVAKIACSIFFFCSHNTKALGIILLVFPGPDHAISLFLPACHSCIIIINKKHGSCPFRNIFIVSYSYLPPRQALLPWTVS